MNMKKEERITIWYAYEHDNQTKVTFVDYGRWKPTSFPLGFPNCRIIELVHYEREIPD